MQRACAKCGILKELAEFRPRKRAPFVHSSCLKCEQEYRKARYRKQRDESPEKLREQQREWRAKNPEKVREYDKQKWAKKKGDTSYLQYQKEYRETHREELNARQRVRNIENRADYLWDEYSLAIDDFIQMLESQQNSCAICGDKFKPEGTVQWNVDHDHISGKVRGILCNSCNRAIGYFKDDPDRCEKAALYLKNHLILGTLSGPVS